MAQITPREARCEFRLRRAFYIQGSLSVIGALFLIDILYSVLALTSSVSAALGFFINAFFIIILVIYRYIFFGKECGRTTFLSLTNIKAFCPHCDKYIPRLMNWRCGYCDADNTDQIENPVIYKCEHCDREPKSYICYHCQETVFFDGDNDARHPARSVGFPQAEEPQDPIKEKKKEHAFEKLKLESDIELTQLRAKLLRIKASPEFKEKLSAAEKIEKEFSEHDANMMGLQMLAKTQRKLNQDQFKDDPNMYEKKELSLKMFLREQGLDED